MILTRPYVRPRKQNLTPYVFRSKNRRKAPLLKSPQQQCVEGFGVYRLLRKRMQAKTACMQRPKKTFLTLEKKS
jgi:hypothetical protein